MNVEHKDEEFVDVESRGSEYNKQNSDPPPEITRTKPNEFKSYRKKVRRWLLFTRTPAQLQGPHVLVYVSQTKEELLKSEEQEGDTDVETALAAQESDTDLEETDVQEILLAYKGS